MLDEPDAHLDIVRQRAIYELLRERAREARSQLLLATHSEVLLRQAVDQDLVVRFESAPR